MRSIINRQAAKASARCGDDATMAMDESPTTRWPRRWRMVRATSGYCARMSCTIASISFSAIGR
jgi:hypothetical protein